MAYFKAKNAPQSISAGSPPQTPLGELTALPQTPSWIGGLLLRGGEGRGGKGNMSTPQHKFLVAPQDSREVIYISLPSIPFSLGEDLSNSPPNRRSCIIGIVGLFAVNVMQHHVFMVMDLVWHLGFDFFGILGSFTSHNLHCHQLFLQLCFRFLVFARTTKRREYPYVFLFPVPVIGLL